MSSASTNAGPSDERLRCPWPDCGTTFNLGRPQDRERHIGSQHLPYQFFCTTPSCYWRGGRKDEFNTHSKKCHPGDEREPGVIYDLKLVVGYIDDGSPVRRAEKYVLDFVAERALELGKVEEWADLCGRQAKIGWCRCDEQHD
ncbi:hypothetical protein BJV78DRAFT_699727 [Lactifluus subvellereus]|nr:hypothetical protein BJV78DRAFT_699727 [Lactifluus subvellereus]